MAVHELDASLEQVIVWANPEFETLAGLDDALERSGCGARDLGSCLQTHQIPKRSLVARMTSSGDEFTKNYIEEGC